MSQREAATSVRCVLPVIPRTHVFILFCELLSQFITSDQLTLLSTSSHINQQDTEMSAINFCRFCSSFVLLSATGRSPSEQMICFLTGSVYEHRHAKRDII